MFSSPENVNWLIVNVPPPVVITCQPGAIVVVLAVEITKVDDAGKLTL
jgi:hypothetical protein